MKCAVLALLLLPHVADVNATRELRRVSGDGHSTSLRIVTWNIDHGDRLTQITSDLQTRKPDLLLLQEVDWNAARSGLKDVAFELAGSLTMDASYGIEFEELSQEKDGAAYIGQATLSRLPLKTSRVLRFERQSNFWQPHSWLPNIPLMQRRLGSRIALVTEHEFAGKRLVVYNPHLESRSMGRIQMAQLNEILSDLKAHYPPDTTAIIAGDINSKYFPSIFLHKLENLGFHSALGPRIARTHKIAMALDWIFVRGPFTLEGGDVDKAAHGSDHYPVSVRLSVSGADK